VSIEILDAADPARLSSFGKPPADPAICYLAAFVARGPASYIDNADVRMQALRVADRILPLVIAERVPGNSNICSAYAHYFEYASEEFARRVGRVPLALLKLPRSLLGTLLRRNSIDRIVYVNNWLLGTNPGHDLSSAQIAELTSFLTRRYPEHAIVFRSSNRLSDPSGFAALRANRYRFIPSRRVYMLDTSDPRYLERSNIHTDAAVLRKTAYSIIDDPAELGRHASRCAALYRALNLDKYSPLNPQYNASFFALILNGKFFTSRAFIKDRHVDAFISFLINDRVIVGALIGYDLDRPRRLGLYRAGFALLIAEAARQGLLVNLSAGSGEFKMLRGAVPVQEYDAVYDRHLPARRRLAWTCIGAVAQTGRLFASRPRV
jgi:hypothetical protein